MELLQGLVIFYSISIQDVYTKHNFEFNEIHLINDGAPTSFNRTGTNIIRSFTTTYFMQQNYNGYILLYFKIETYNTTGVDLIR